MLIYNYAIVSRTPRDLHRFKKKIEALSTCKRNTVFG